jgi:hypothetical protein
MKRHVGWLCAVAVILSLVARDSAAQLTPEKPKLSAAEEKAQIARRGAGLIINSWSLVDDPTAGTSSTIDDLPLGEGFFRKGLDKHVALETTVGVWRRVITNPGTPGPFGTPGGKTTVFLLPQMTAIKLYPFTTPENKFEPFISAGVGLTLGLTSESGSGGLVGGGGGVSGLVAGLGARFTTGAEWRFSKAFGLTAGGHYSYIHFFESLAGQEMYRGTGVMVGLTYRFQY